MLLDSLFNAVPSEKLQNPTARFNWKENESLRFRLGTDMTELTLLVRHYVDGIGYVKCNQTPTRLRDGRFGLFGDCVFCKARKVAKDDLAALVASEGRQATKDEANAASNLYKRTINLLGTAEVETRKGRDVIKPLEAKAIMFRVSDMFFDHLNQHYKVLSQVYQNKGTLKGMWFTMGGKESTVMFDDRTTTEDETRPIEVDLAFFDKQTKTYEVGKTKLEEKLASVAAAKPIEEPVEEESDIVDDSETVF